MLNKRGGSNKRGESADFFLYYMKINGEGGNFSVYYMENKGRGEKFLKLNKQVYPFIRHLRVRAILTCLKHSGRPLKFLNPN